MGKASSAKKIKRVQQAGATRAPGQRRQIAYPALIVVILLLGLVGTALAVNHRRSTEAVAPTVDDRWFEAYGTYVCGEFLPNQSPVVDGAPITLYSDGLINVAPEDDSSSGDNATFELFLESMGIAVGAEAFTLSDGTTYTNGDDCNGEEGRVALYVWPPQSGENTDPRIITSAIPTTRFTDDGQSYVLVFNPRDSEVPLPPSAANLDDPSTDPAAVVPSSAPAEDSSGSETTTTAGN